jgi:dihydroorotase
MPKTKKKTSGTQDGSNTASLLIRGGRVIDPASGMDGEFDVLLHNSKVAEIASPGQIRSKAEQNINARNLVVAPGFIDLHVHLREPGQEHKETIATGTAAAAAGGFTSVCAMPNTSPVNDSPEITAWMQDPDRNAVVNVFPIAAATRGSQGKELTDFSALQYAGAVGFTDDGRPILGDNVMRHALEAANRLNLPVIQHAEDTTMTAGCSMHEGANAFRLGLRGIPPQSESNVVERDIQLARETGTRLHVAHLSTAGALDAVRRGKRDRVRVTCEVTPHHFTLTDTDIHGYDTRYKMNPPLRSEADVEAMIAGLADGSIDAIATDHAPHAMHEKLVEFDRAPFGITGLETALALAITRLHLKHGIPLQRIVELLSAGPARNFNLRGRGTGAPGSIADVTIFDPKQRWMYDAKSSPSKSHNTPFDGWQFTGKVVATIVSGRVVYRNG